MHGGHGRLHGGRLLSASWCQTGSSRWLLRKLFPPQLSHTSVDTQQLNISFLFWQCSYLEDAGLEHILYPGSDLYTTRTESYFSVSAQLEPYCIVQPTSAEDVSLIVTTLGNTKKCQWAIRSGGHTVWPGANNSTSNP